MSDRGSGSARAEVADFWDDVLERWLDGHEHVVPPLDRWLRSYQGTGKGAVDLAHYPDPYVGDLRGHTHEPRLAVLGLNPGVGYDDLQSPTGTWAERIRDVGYSACLARSPAEDPQSWVALHGRESRFWRNLVTFARRWLNDPDASVRDILNFELYPWHSNAVNAPMRPPPDLIERFVWAPAQEIDTPAVFAFGAPWFSICDDLGLPVVAQYGKGGKPFPQPVRGGWRLSAYQLPSGRLAVVSAQQGYAGPPGLKRLNIMRGLVDQLAAH